MNDFDMRRIENAIWILDQYDWEIRELLKEEGSNWDGEKKIPLIYVKDENGNWKFISELTDRQLRIRHNLEKLYVNGEFCNVEQ